MYGRGEKGIQNLIWKSGWKREILMGNHMVQLLRLTLSKGRS
jgi:hypothetical protein